MSKFPWMPFYVQDFRMKTLDLRVDEIGLYFILLCLCWQRSDAGLPNDMAWLKRTLKCCIADFHGHTFNRIVPKLLQRYFELGSDGVWRQARLVEEWEKTRKRSANASQSANKRWSDYRSFKDLANKKAILSQSQRKKEAIKQEGTNGRKVEHGTEKVGDNAPSTMLNTPSHSELRAVLQRKGWL